MPDLRTQADVLGTFKLTLRCTCALVSGASHHSLQLTPDLSCAGVLTSDPRIVRSARPVPLLTYEEATELAFFGATVLHPLAMQPAIQSECLAVRVKNSFNRCVQQALSR